MNPAEAYVARYDAVEEQAARFRAGRPALSDRWASVAAARFRFDPARPLAGAAAMIAPYLQPDDVLLDVGGGAGRMGLALSRYCREVINIEPSQGMGETFVASVRDSHIGNARWVQDDWLQASDVQGDVAIVAHVTYFVRDIVPFIEVLRTRTRRRVALVLFSIPPHGNMPSLFASVLGEPLLSRPGHRELLPVLWELDILPDVHIFTDPAASLPVVVTRTDAEIMALRTVSVALNTDVSEDKPLRADVQHHFDSLFIPVEGGWQATWVQPGTNLLITWETGGDTAADSKPGTR